MKLKELTRLLTIALEKPINQSMIALALGITRQTISNRVKNDSELTVSELIKIEKYFNVNLSNNIDGFHSSEIVIDYYPDIFASCGNGAILFSQDKETVAFPRQMLSSFSNNKKYSMIHARGDSMSPYITDGDKLIIEHCEGEQIIDNKIYVFCYKQEFFVKKLSKNVDEVIVASENPAYSNRILKNKDLSDLFIIGKVVSILRSV